MRSILIFSCFLLLAGCATPYQPNSFMGGYNEFRLSQDTYRISFNGNGFSSAEYVQNTLLRRSADLTIQNDYRYFMILAGNTHANNSYYTTPARVQTQSFGSYSGTGNMYGNYYGNNMIGNYSYNGFGNQNSYTTITPPQTHVVTRYGSSVIIKMLKSKKGHPTALDANIILSNFMQKNND